MAHKYSELPRREILARILETLELILEEMKKK